MPMTHTLSLPHHVMMEAITLAAQDAADAAVGVARLVSWWNGVHPDLTADSFDVGMLAPGAAGQWWPVLPDDCRVVARAELAATRSIAKIHGLVVVFLRHPAAAAPIGKDGLLTTAGGTSWKWSPSHDPARDAKLVLRRIPELLPSFYRGLQRRQARDHAELRQSEALTRSGALSRRAG